MIDYDRTFALVVGLEQYDFPGLDMAGPCSGVVKVANHLLDSKVPPGNISLFTTAPKAGDKDRAQQIEKEFERLRRLGVVSKGIPTFDIVDTYWRNDLISARPADSQLFVYWAGHGYTHSNKHRIFLYKDYSENVTNRVLDTNVFLKRLHRWPFGEQLHLFDVCGTHRRKTLQFETNDTDLELEDVKQIVYFATPEGRTTGTTPSGGSFTKIALQTLTATHLWSENFEENFNRELVATKPRPFRVDYYGTLGERTFPAKVPAWISAKSSSEVFNRLRANAIVSTRIRFPVYTKEIADDFAQYNRVLIEGRFGEGKTDTALQYAEEYSQNYKRVFWCDAATPGALLSSYSELAKELGQVTQVLAQSDSFEEIGRWCATNCDWLLVLDGVENLDHMKDLIPAGEGHVLITSSDLLVPSDLSLKGVQIKMEDPDSRVQFLVSLLAQRGICGDQRLAEIVSTQLTTRLELDKAVLHMTAFGNSLANFVSDVLPKFNPGNVAWCRRAIEEVPKNSATMDLLRVTAFIAPEQIPVRIFEDGAESLGENIKSAKQKDDHWDSMLAPAHRVRLIARDLADSGMFSTYRDVQHTVKQDMVELVKLNWWTQTLNAVAVCFDGVRSEDSYGDYTPHIEALMRFEPVRGKNLGRALELLVSAGLAHLERENYYYAHSLLTSAEGMANRNDAGPVEKANILLHKADLFLRQMRSSDKKDRQQLRGKALDHIEKARKLGEAQNDQRIIAGAEYAIAKAFWWADDQGKNAQEATAHHFEKSYKLAKDSLGQGNSRLADILTDWAEFQRYTRNNSGARQNWMRALRIRKKMHQDREPRDQRIGLLYHSLAELNREECKYGESDNTRKWYLLARCSLGSAFPDGHPSLAHIDNSLGEFYRVLGEFSKAREAFEMALQARDQFDNEKVAAVLDSLGNTYCGLRDFDAAARVLAEALDLAESKPVVAQIRNSLGDLWRLQGDYDKAETEIGEALRIREDDADGTAESLTSFGELARAKGNPKEAEEMFRQALEIRERLGVGFSAADSYQHLAALYQSTGDKEKASEYRTKAGDILRRCGLELQDNVL